MAWFIAYAVSVVLYFFITYHIFSLDVYHSSVNTFFGFTWSIILFVILALISKVLEKKGIIEPYSPPAPPPNVSPSTKALVDSVFSESSGISSAVSEEAPLSSPYEPPKQAVAHVPTADEMLQGVDRLDGPGFEKWCASLLERSGFIDVQLTKASGDQGVDVVAVKDDIRYAFQCKCYSSDLGNHPVQEVHAGKSLYGCHVGIVITNRYFTPGAKELAKATGVLLWDRDKLKSILRTIYGDEYVPPIVGRSIFEDDSSSFWD